MLLLLFLLVVSLRVQAQPREELSKEGILCIMQSREETALGRWLRCLQLSSSQNLQDPELPTIDIEHEQNSQIELFTMGQEDVHEKSAVDEVIPQVEQLTLNKGELPVEGKLPGGGIDVFKRLDVHFEDAEKAISSHLEPRAMRDDTLLLWLKLNLGMLAFSKLLFSLIRRCNWKKGSIKSSEPSTMCLTEDSREATPEISKAVIVDEASSKKLHMVGSSLGSAVGAVFAEVLLKTCNSGSSLPSDKISLLLESALKELCILVEGDDGCSRLIADFVFAFKSTYATIHRIQQVCTSYEASREINLHSQRDNSFSKATCEKHCTSAKSNDEIFFAPRTDLSDDGWQVKQSVPLHSCSANHKKEKLESRSLLDMDVLSEQDKLFVTSADHGEFDSGAPATSTVEIHDSVLAAGFEKPELNCERQETPSCASSNDGFECTSFNTSSKLKDEGMTQLDYEVDDASSVCEEPSSIMPRLDALALMFQSHPTGDSELQKDFLKIYERCVRAQEQHNQIKFVKLKHFMKQQILEEEKIQLTIVANGLMRENIDLDRSKASFKENRVLEEQAKAAYVSFSTMCADELAAGLLVMLAALVYSVRKYSFALLSDLVSTCQPAAKEPRRSFGFHMDWFYNSLAGKLQAFVCHVSVTGRISFGLVLVAVVASSLLRRSVTSSSQAMPATILIIVLGGICGFIGKVSVDSLGGSGNQWWVVWGAFCFLHAIINCFTPSVWRLLHLSPTGVKARFGLPFWIRQLAFHITLVLVLPVLAGLLPFGSLSLVVNDLFLTLTDILAKGFSSLYEWSAQLA